MNTKTLQTDLKEHPVYLAIHGGNLSPKSKKALIDCLIGFIAQDQGRERSEIKKDEIYSYEWEGLSANKVESVLSDMQIKPATYSKYLWAIRKIAKVMLRDTDLVAKNFNYKDYMRLDQITKLQDARSPRKDPVRRRLTIGEIEDLARVCAEDESPAGARDIAMIDLMYTQGPRVSELSKMQLKNYDPETGIIKILNAKGGKDRKIRAANTTKEAIDLWIAIRGNEPGPLFTRVNKGGEIEIAKLTQQAISSLIFSRCKQANVDRFSPHDLRATYATTAIGRKVPIPRVQKILGHSSSSTTMRYDLTTEQEALETAEVIHAPNIHWKGGGNGH